MTSTRAPLPDGSGVESLDALIARIPSRRLETGRFLVLACGMSHAIGELHERGLFHLDIKPENFVLGPGAAVRLTGIGAASRSRRERQPPFPPEKIAGTFTHMAPEQTGRMNRSVDARSDLYSLGITFYEMLTGSLPFSASDPMGWIHSHIARQPLPPSERAPDVPDVLNRITLKLLAKNPEDRYQTASGLELDLRRCLSEWQTRGHLDTFDLGSRDVPDFLVLPEKLYGRGAEVALLNAVFERVASTGMNELVLICGGAGIGKSSLVNELHKVLVGSRGQFAAGKFDQYKRGIPYATLAEAFQGLIRQLLSKREEELAVWRSRLVDALGPNGQLMVDLIPDLALIVGEQAPPPSVEAQEAAARFKRVFLRFVKVFASGDHPLVLFIDDLQWLDAGTLELLEALATAPDRMSLMLIGAYRDNEVGTGHPLEEMLSSLRSGGGRISELQIVPLQADHVTELIADALHTSVARSRPLAELVFEKTAGNPFFANQFITELVDDGLLTFDRSDSRWTWNIERIRAKQITDNVALLMAVKMGRLSAGTRRVLSRHACLGNQGALSILAMVLESTENEVRNTLAEAVDAGMVLLEKDTVRFSHDRVHEAAYGLLRPGERCEAHLRIGKVLLAQTKQTDIDDRIFEIVNQLDRGKDAIRSPAERELTAELFLRAGKRAKASSAYASALTHFASARALLGEAGWDRQRALTFALELNSAECEITTSDFAGAETRLRALGQRDLDIIDESSVVCLAVLLYFTTGRSERAVEEALRYLSRVGISWSPRPAESEVRSEYEEMRRHLAQRSIGGLAAMPAMTDAKSLAIMAVLTELFPAAYAVDRFLLDLVLLRMTNMSLEHGNCESSSVAYSAINMALGPHFSDYQTAYQLGEIACELVERREANRFKARVYSCFAAFTMPWIKHLPQCRPLMMQAFQIGSSMGDMAFAAYNSRNLMTHLLVSGEPLAQVQLEAQQAMDFAKRIQLGLPAECFIEQLELVQKLRGIYPDKPVDDEWAMGDVEHDPRLAMMVCYHWGFRLQERFLAGDFPAAKAAARRIEPIRWAMRSSIEEAEFELYAALACAAVTCETEEERELQLGELTRRHARLAVWAGTCPENFSCRAALVGAELARISGHELDAQHLYEQSLVQARAQGFLQIEALANELAGLFYAARDLATSANAYLRNARECYERWGAVLKVRQIDLRFPQLEVQSSLVPASARIETPVLQLDVEAVDKVSQTLSSEMILSSLIEKLMRLAIEHAGAERGMLVLLDGERPYVEAEAATAGGGIEVDIKRTPVEQSRLPQSALQYVLRTHQRLVLDDASADGLNSSDEYVRRYQPRSVLCLPIFRQADAIGALYLENNLTTRAFTSGRVAVLDFLASQAAIWLDNARLYSDLRRSEAWLKEAQHLSSTGSFYWGVDSERIEFSEQMYRIYDLPIGKPVTIEMIAERFHPDDEPIRLEILEVGRSGIDLDYMFRVRMPDQSVKHLHMVAHGSRNKDGKLEYIGAVQDVTQSRLSEEALGKVRSELSHVARVTSLGALTASIAHEVNQPITGIVTNASTCLRMLAAEPPNVAGARETAQRMIRDGRRAAEVITRLRALFVSKRGVTEAVDLNEATAEVITLAASELRKSGVIVRLMLEENLPRVSGDRVQLQQVILNLLLNAADALRPIVDRPRIVEISTEFDGAGSVCLKVRDTGVGIDAESAPRLFEAFYSTKSGGMGIGLSVSRSILESHQGQIWAAPNDGPGATFAFSVPIAAPRRQPD